MTINIDVKSLKSHIPALLALGAAVWAQYGTTITHYIGAHPKLAGWEGFGAFIVAYYLHSPAEKKQEAPAPEPPKVP